MDYSIIPKLPILNCVNDKKLIQNFQFGLISGINAIIISHPIDTIKTNFQENKPIKYTPRFLYKGLCAPLLGVGLEKSIVFGVFETTRPYTNSDAISGALSGLMASFVVTPFERIKILLQTNNSNINHIMKNLNYRFLFQGLSATFYRETPGFAIYFSTYNYLKADKEISLIQSFCYGALSGSFAWIFIYPQDRIKTHIQAMSDKKMGFMEGLKEIVSIKNGGYKGLYRGFHYALMRAIPLHATAFMTMEFCKKYF